MVLNTPTGLQDRKALSNAGGNTFNLWLLTLLRIPDKETETNFAEWLEIYSEHCKRAVKYEEASPLLSVYFSTKGSFCLEQGFLLNSPVVAFSTAQNKSVPQERELCCQGGKNSLRAFLFLFPMNKWGPLSCQGQQDFPKADKPLDQQQPVPNRILKCCHRWAIEQRLGLEIVKWGWIFLSK